MATNASAQENESRLKADRQRKKVLRIAHLTDVHVQPEQGAPHGMARALQHAQNLADKPDVIFNGGDSIMDALGADKARTKTQWQVWQSVLRNECSLPIEHCIGNHDVWGWELKNKIAPDKLYGKQWALEEFALASRYRSFELAGWHFIVLDSTHPAPQGYIGKLDEPQFEWLEEDLQKTPHTTPVCVLSHIPIICFCCFFDGENETEKSGDWKVPGAWMHIDARRIKNLFHRHANVKLCLSGHIHLQDRVDYLGVKYLCNGAVSGNWWDGSYQEFPPAYVIVDLFDDGTSENEFVPY
jgi:3',5'-cyclic AMP phosphodiesterase CpdA